jgi:hypothetical protein
MVAPPSLYTIRIRGRLGATALSAFPTMAATLSGSETVLTGVLEDQSAMFGVLAQIEALGLELLELRHGPAQVAGGGESPPSGEDNPPRSLRPSIAPTTEEADRR